MQNNYILCSIIYDISIYSKGSTYGSFNPKYKGDQAAKKTANPAAIKPTDPAAATPEGVITNRINPATMEESLHSLNEAEEEGAGGGQGGGGIGPSPGG